MSQMLPDLQAVCNPALNLQRGLLRPRKGWQELICILATECHDVRRRNR